MGQRVYMSSQVDSNYWHTVPSTSSTTTIASLVKVIIDIMGLHTSRSLRYTVLVLLFTLPTAFSTALTAILNAHERACYYADVDGVGEKIGTSPVFIPLPKLPFVYS